MFFTIKKIINDTIENLIEISFREKHPILDLDGYNSKYRLGYNFKEILIQSNPLCTIFNIPKKDQTTKKSLEQCIINWLSDEFLSFKFNKITTI